MAALTGDITSFGWSGLGPRQTKTYVTKNAAQPFVGSLMELSGGLATPYVQNLGATNPVIGVAVGGGIPGSNPVLDGYALQTFPIPMIAPGNVSTAAVGNANKVIVEQGAFTWQQVTLTIAGTLAGSVADNGTKLFAASDNIADSVTTNPGTDKVLGVITAFYSKTATTAIYDIFIDSYDARTRAN